MAKFALIGNPITHSKSPALFKAAYPEGKDTYSLLQAPTCKEAIERFTSEGFSGCNVTSPFKDDVMEYISLPDRISSILSSANTVISREGKLHSFNTDYYGVRNTLSDFLESKGKKDGMPSLTTLVIGAGGAGKAAALAVCDMGMRVFFANRSSNAATPFASKIGAEFIPLDKIPQILHKTDIIIYNLSMGIGQLQGISLEGKVVFEANYAHPNLANSGAESYISGRYWLYNQAIPAFKLFTGKEPDTVAMKQVMGI